MHTQIHIIGSTAKLTSHEGQTCVSFRTIEGRGLKPILVPVQKANEFLEMLKSAVDIPTKEVTFKDWDSGKMYQVQFYNFDVESFSSGKGAGTQMLILTSEFDSVVTRLEKIFLRAVELADKFEAYNA